MVEGAAGDSNNGEYQENQTIVCQLVLLNLEKRYALWLISYTMTQLESGDVIDTFTSRPRQSPRQQDRSRDKMEAAGSSSEARRLRQSRAFNETNNNLHSRSVIC